MTMPGGPDVQPMSGRMPLTRHPRSAVAAAGAAEDAAGGPPAGITGAAFRACFDALAAIGRDAERGGWSRLAWTAEDAAARAWFVAEAEARDLAVEQDRNGDLWAWWRPEGATGAAAVVTGSHLDTVTGGGAYDGALGVVAGLLAVDALRAGGARPVRPVAVVAFADEEGARSGLPTFASRLLTGALLPAAVLARTTTDGEPLGEVLAAAGVDPAGIGSDPGRLAGVAAFVELHVEQGRGLVDLRAPVGVATGIWPHGRWRLVATGEGNHAGTTRMADRRDPTRVLAAAITGAAVHAVAAGGVATIGRVLVDPNGTNSVPARVVAWLDARAPDEDSLTALLDGWNGEVGRAADACGVTLELVEESRTPAVTFDPELADRVAAVLDGPPRLPTAAGHDAGALAATVPTAMLFVRNPTGVSHSPAEHADDADCLAGIAALQAVLEDLACR